jgi:predicted enzyme related to lactoylglutathione lyase
MRSHHCHVHKTAVQIIDSKKLVQLGGKIIMPKTKIPNMGHFAVALDPEGNGFGIFESRGE